ncbi:MAG: hypothetical protein JNL82_11845 [Myxococcales bacterium]|nr:hypothetical protein [Myxococcales bacterium]
MRPARLALSVLVLGCGDSTGGSASGSSTTVTTAASATESPPTTDASAGTTTGGASDDATASPPATASPATSEPGSTSLLLDVGADETTDGCQPGGEATLTGVVTVPNGTIPISGALVYLTHDAPTIPQTVYCSECVDLACGTAYTFTGPDGSFSLDAPAGAWNVVVQKGQFMRVTALDVVAGDNPLAAELTRMPDHNDPPAGQFIPRVALALGDHDHLEDALAKLGLGATETKDFKQLLVNGSQQFDVWDNAPDRDFPGSMGSFAQLVGNYALMEKYHVIFVPCTQQAGEYLEALDDPAVQANIQTWVANGGKWYVADWSSEAISVPFPQYQDFWLRKDSTTVEQWKDQNTADLGRYDPLGTVLDPDLEAWLDALPPDLKDINPVNDPDLESYPVLDALPDVQTMYVYSGVKAVHEVLVPDNMGGQVDVGHKVWIEGPGAESWGVPPADMQWPLTITGEYGCGRIMFTAYHTVESGGYVGLSPQELILMYLILEIGVCQTPYAPPQ